MNPCQASAAVLAARAVLAILAAVLGVNQEGVTK